MPPAAAEVACASNAGVQDFKECLRHLQDGRYDDGLSHAKRALELAPRNPFYMSYTGLLTALAGNQYREAEKLCKEAITAKRGHPQPYLNLAEVYVQARRPIDAMETLEKGLLSAGRDIRLRHALQRIGLRREPVLPSLARSNPLNKLLGKLRHRLLGPLKVM